jgi:hypothetical protein
MRGNASLLFQEELFQEHSRLGAALSRLVIVAIGFYSKDCRNEYATHLFS